MNWKEVYKLPLKSIESLPSWVNSSNGVHALDIFAHDKLCESLVRVLNGEEAEFDKKHEFVAKESNIYCDGELLMRVRGWGYLTGGGALKLPSEEAILIQNEFVKYIIDKLKNVSIKTPSPNEVSKS